MLINQWNCDGLFTGYDAAALQNQDKPTVMTQWGAGIRIM